MDFARAVRTPNTKTHPLAMQPPDASVVTPARTRTSSGKARIHGFDALYIPSKEGKTFKKLSKFNAYRVADEWRGRIPQLSEDENDLCNNLANVVELLVRFGLLERGKLTEDFHQDVFQAAQTFLAKVLVPDAGVLVHDFGVGHGPMLYVEHDETTFRGFGDLVTSVKTSSGAEVMLLASEMKHNLPAQPALGQVVGSKQPLILRHLKKSQLKDVYPGLKCLGILTNALIGVGSFIIDMADEVPHPGGTLQADSSILETNGSAEKGAQW